jgi:hypothetical protein
MPEGDLPTREPAGDGEAGEQENGHAPAGPAPPWSHTWYEEEPRRKRKRRDRTNGQNGRAGPSVPRGGSRVEGDDDSSDDEVHVPYKQVWVSFVSQGSRMGQAMPLRGVYRNAVVAYAIYNMGSVIQ